MEDDALEFLEETEENLTSEVHDYWNVLVVDDEKDIHIVTNFAMEGYEYQGKRINFISAMDSIEAKDVLNARNDIALILLDVSMETTDSGLLLVRYIREELKNHIVQIILRTGHPGDIPEEELIKIYDINDYKLKSELTREKLFTAVTVSLRAFDISMKREKLQASLEASNKDLQSLNENLESLVNSRTKELVEKNQELGSSLSENRNLVRVLSHDLNNYLSLILGASELGLRHDNAKIIRLFTKIKKAANSQLNIIRDVRDLNAISSGKKNIDLELVSVADLVKEVIFTFSDALKKKNLDFRVVWECPQTTKILVNPVIFVNSVLNNIVSNSVKFSLRDSVISMHILAEDDRICIKITDHGIGIPKRLLEVLFSSFSKTSRVGTDGESGTGFGMPIMKSMLEKMHGKVWVESFAAEDGYEKTGTSFFVSLKTAFQD